MEKQVPDNCLINPDRNYKTVETKLATLWMDEDGIVYSKSKQYKRSVKALREYFEALKKLSSGEKVYVIGDLNEMQNYSSEEKEYLNQQMEKTCSGVAILSCKPMGKMMATVAILKTKPSFPARMFEDLESAMAWIKKLRAKQKRR